MVRNDRRAQRAAAEKGLRRKGYAEESIQRWLDFWDQPLMATAFEDKGGFVIGYIDPVRGRVEDRSGKLNEKYQTLYGTRPRLTV